jgi:hypothetical protein
MTDLTLYLSSLVNVQRRLGQTVMREDIFHHHLHLALIENQMWIQDIYPLHRLRQPTMSRGMNKASMCNNAGKA